MESAFANLGITELQLMRLTDSWRRRRCHLWNTAFSPCPLAFLHSFRQGSANTWYIGCVICLMLQQLSSRNLGIISLLENLYERQKFQLRPVPFRVRLSNLPVRVKKFDLSTWHTGLTYPTRGRLREFTKDRPRYLIRVDESGGLTCPTRCKLS